MEKQYLILFYNTMFEMPLEYPVDELPEDFCITTDKSHFQRADCVVFHLPDLWRIIGNDELDKREGQIWVAWNLECEVNYPWVDNPGFSKLFDLRMGYRETDDVIHSYCKHSYKDMLSHLQPVVPRKNKTCMFISSHINRSGRREYLHELMKHTEIDSYGRLFNNRKLQEDIGDRTLLNTIRDYKFVIAFENAIARDYVTEKFYNPLLAGTVPVYSGAPNIGDFVPGENCFVDVRAFESPKQLADFINRCYADDGLYQRFHRWKEEPLLPGFINKTKREQNNPIIRLCAKLRQIQNS